MLSLDEGAADGSIPIVCPSCRDLVSVEGRLEDVSVGDPISAFCASCERTVEVAAPVGIEAVEARADTIAPALTEFAADAPQA